MPDTGENVYLTYEEAAASLNWQEDGSVHTFVGSRGALVGADWPREQVEELLRTGNPQLAGTLATVMGHGIVAEWHQNGAPIFLETINLED